MGDQEEFQVVRWKKSRRKPLAVDVQHDVHLFDPVDGTAFDAITCKKRLNDCIQELKLHGDFLDSSCHCIKQCLETIINCDPSENQQDSGIDVPAKNPKAVEAERNPGRPAMSSREESSKVQILCYGIGNFSTCVIARYQLAFLVTLRRNLKIQCSECLFYDPVLSEQERDFLREEGFLLIAENEEGKHLCPVPTVAFLPHCGKALYNNLLWKNLTSAGQEGLHNLLLIGNSFSHMVDSTPWRILNKTASYVLKLAPYTCEVPLSGTFKHQDVFNDLGVHTFPRVALANAPSSLLESLPEPVYDVRDLEFIPR